jgi:hypothetical protein
MAWRGVQESVLALEADGEVCPPEKSEGLDVHYDMTGVDSMLCKAELLCSDFYIALLCY